MNSRLFILRLLIGIHDIDRIGRSEQLLIQLKSDLWPHAHTQLTIYFLFAVVQTETVGGVDPGDALKTSSLGAGRPVERGRGG